MSRIGNRKISVPENVTVTINDNNVVVKGPKGELSTKLTEGISVKVEDNEVIVTRNNDSFKTMHGTTNANINNMITGVTTGFEKKLEAVGVGYRFQVKGNTLVVSAGYSNPVEMNIPEGITLESPSNTELFVRGIDKQLVGNFAAEIRDIRRPEPYKGKGIRYADEHVRRKEGKKAA